MLAAVNGMDPVGLLLAMTAVLAYRLLRQR
jgi:hypothetical protein